MNHKTGLKETSASLIIFSLSPALLVLVGGNCAILGSGALINCTLCFVIAIFMALSTKFYFFVCGNQNIIESSCIAAGRVISCIVGITFAIFIFIATCISLRTYSSEVSSLSQDLLQYDSLVFVFCLAAGFCAWLGIEALTRQSYVILMLGFAIIVFLIFTTFGGINTDNIYPVFGTSFRGTFGSFICLSLYMGIAPLLLFCDCLNSAETGVKCALRTVTIAFAIALVLFALYVTTVPYPLGKLFPHSMQAIFASASTGELFHRFELFLAALFSVFAVVSAAVGIAAVSSCLARVCSVSDTRPFVLILTVMLYHIADINFSTSVYLFVCLSLVVISFFIPLIIAVILYTKKH